MNATTKTANKSASLPIDATVNYDLGAERALIGCMVQNHESIDLIQSNFSKRAFHSAIHREVYSTLVSMEDEKTPIDMISVNHELKKLKSPFSIADLADSIQTSVKSNYSHYCKIITDFHIERVNSIACRSFLSGDLTPEEMIQQVTLGMERKAKLAGLDNLFTFSKGSQGFDANQSWIIKGIIPAQSVGQVYGASGSYKTFCVLDMAFHVSCGADWLGNKTDLGAVIYVAGEGQLGVKRRIRALEIKNGFQADNLHLINQSIDLLDAEKVDLLIVSINALNEVSETPVKLLVLDTLARCYSGDENNAQDMNRAIMALDKVKHKTGVSCLTVHHTGKDKTKGARGSSAGRGAWDYEFEIDKPDEVLTGNSKEFTVRCTKMKDAPDGFMINCSLSVVELGIQDEDEKQITSLVVSREKITPTDEAQAQGMALVRAIKGVFSGEATRKQARDYFIDNIAIGSSDRAKAKQWDRAIFNFTQRKRGEIEIVAPSGKKTKDDILKINHL